ncbi:hypothetical protein SAMN04488524_0503 [Pedobacter africanus]|uniref:Uncharacterized protein n=1 Tax=Pedobacter africanus TaxID=151894 RepID=A0A1W1Z9E3_9SPHI|nr:hypothetical protein SAMN04488524_0503 [Pedobacter africanus]
MVKHRLTKLYTNKQKKRHSSKPDTQLSIKFLIHDKALPAAYGLAAGRFSIIPTNSLF